MLAGKISGEPAEFKTTMPSTGTQTGTGSDSGYIWGLALLMSLPLGIYLAYRGHKMWKLRERRVTCNAKVLSLEKEIHVCV